MAYDLSTLGDIAHYKKDLREASHYYTEAIELYQELGDSQSRLICQGNVAEIARLLGDYPQALKLHSIVLEAIQDSNNNFLISGLLQPVAHLCLDMGDPANTALLLSSSEALRRQGGFALDTDAQSEFDRLKEAARQRLGQGLFQEQWDQGQALTGRQAVNYTLANVVQSVTSSQPGSQLEESSAELRLTGREKQVAALAAQGLTNREIATSLGLSKRTVDNHLHRVFEKLGVQSRIEIAETLNQE
jgi:non-specific serine/threonine protein kinase